MCLSKNVIKINGLDCCEYQSTIFILSTNSKYKKLHNMLFFRLDILIRPYAYACPVLDFSFNSF